MRLLVSTCLFHNLEVMRERQTCVHSNHVSNKWKCSPTRRLQYDYTGGQLPALTDVIIKNKAALFVCAVGVPPKEMVDKLHTAGIVVMKCVLGG